MKIKEISINLNRKELMVLINLINNNIYEIKEPREKITLSDISAKLCKGIHDLSVQSIELKGVEKDNE